MMVHLLPNLICDVTRIKNFAATAIPTCSGRVRVLRFPCKILLKETLRGVFFLVKATEGRQAIFARKRSSHLPVKEGTSRIFRVGESFRIQNF